MCKTKCLVELKKAPWWTLQLAGFSRVPVTPEFLTSALQLFYVLPGTVLRMDILLFLWTPRVYKLSGTLHIGMLIPVSKLSLAYLALSLAHVLYLLVQCLGSTFRIES